MGSNSLTRDAFVELHCCKNRVWCFSKIPISIYSVWTPTFRRISYDLGSSVAKPHPSGTSVRAAITWTWKTLNCPTKQKRTERKKRHKTMKMQAWQSEPQIIQWNNMKKHIRFTHILGCITAIEHARLSSSWRCLLSFQVEWSSSCNISHHLPSESGWGPPSMC